MFRKKIRRSREWRKNNQLIDFEKAKELRKQNRDAIIKTQLEAEAEKAEAPSQRIKTKKGRARNLYAGVMVIIIAIIGVSVFNVLTVNSQLEEVLAERRALIAERERLIYMLQNVDSDEFIEHQARASLRMIMPGEIYFIVPKDSE